MADTVALLNCPFCDPLKMALIGRPKIMGYGVGDPAKDPANWHGLCLACGAEGPKEATRCAAAEAWNRRAPPTDMPPAGLRRSPSPAVEALTKALAEIESEPQCCGRGQPMVRGNEVVGEECCGCPEYGLDRAAAVIRDALSSLSPKEEGDG